MGAGNNGNSRASFSSTESSLKKDTPKSFSKAPPARADFNQANAEIKNSQQQARGEGSNMVKKQKPSPELRPKNSQAQIKQSFDAQWLKEHREAQLKKLNAQEKTKPSRTKQQDRQLPSRSLER